MNKGYETYYKLWKYGKDNIDKKIEFIFIGKNKFLILILSLFVKNMTRNA
jgi:hypothetical protein